MCTSGCRLTVLSAGHNKTTNRPVWYRHGFSVGWTGQGDALLMKTIRELRQEREWTQFDLALKVGVHPQAVYLWESGRRMPLVPQIRKLGQVFGLCSDEIALVERVARAGRTGRRPGRPEPSAQGRDASESPNVDDDAGPI